MRKTDVLGWGLVIGVLGAAGYITYRGIGSLPRLPWEMGMANEESTLRQDYIQKGIDRSTEIVAESSQAWDEYLNQNLEVIKTDPGYYNAVMEFDREYREYRDALANYKGESWTNYNVLVNEANQAIAARGRMQNAYNAYLQSRMVQN